MAFLALGINHKTASVDVRERVAFTPDQMVEALRQLCRVTPTREAAILSTCNRSELYLQQDQLEADAVLAWLANYHRLSLDELKACAYVHVDDQAVRHMMRVASGLDSLVLGEPQILGQMKSAYAVAREAGSIGPLLGRLFQATFSTAKTVRTDTAIGENPVSVAFAAVSLARQIFSNLQRSQALLIGAGLGAVLALLVPPPPNLRRGDRGPDRQGRSRTVRAEAPAASAGGDDVPRGCGDPGADERSA